MDNTERNQRISELFSDIEALQAELSARLHSLAVIVTAADTSSKTVVGHRLSIDDATFSVRWNDAICYLGYTITFKLLRRLAPRPNQFVSCDQLRQDVWLGVERSDSTIRSEIRHLRRKLIGAGLEELAAKLCGQGRHYVLRL